jgi:hypothetical protein
MRQFLPIISVAIILAMTGCAGYGVKVQSGESEADVVAKLGAPTHRYQDGSDALLEYMHGPWGQTTYMARIGPDRKVISYEQVLTSQKFATIQLGKSTKDQVLRTIGAPSGTSYLSLPELEVWTYPYKESNVWNSLMHVHFDKAGIVRQMQNGPDPRFEPDVRIPFSTRPL